MAGGHRPRLSPVVAKGRRALAESLEASGRRSPFVLVACSGGPDSLALAAVTAFFARRGDFRAGAVVVDHGLQQGSDQVAERTAQTLHRLGLDPVEVLPVDVVDDGDGPEAAARTARYEALEKAAARLGADTVLLGHTLDDQAETVLLGLARGSGTRSLAGMPSSRGPYLRPFLGLRRQETVAICEAEGLDPWHDPTNQDPAYMRSRIRTEVMPLLEKKLGPGVAESLYRTALILAEDSALLNAQSQHVFDAATDRRRDGSLTLDMAVLRKAPPALRRRALALAAVEVSGNQPSHERLLALDGLVLGTAAGVVQLSGRAQARVEPAANRGPDAGRLVFIRS